MDNELKQILKAFEPVLVLDTEMHGGMMNHSFVMKDKYGNRFVLYIPTEQSNSMVDRDIEHRAVEAYCKLGIAPRSFSFDEETGVKMNEYIPGESLNFVEDINYHEVARLIKTERTAPTMDECYNPFFRLENYEKEKEELGIKDIREEYALLRKVVFANKDILEKGKLCLSHNDFQPSNIVRRVDGVYFLIDYEFAMTNYEMYDIACFGNNDVNMGVKLLEAVYETPKAKDYEAYYLWRMFISLQWYNVALIKDFHGEGKEHNIDFVGVASFFIDNALEAYRQLLELKN